MILPRFYFYTDLVWVFRFFLFYKTLTFPTRLVYFMLTLFFGLAVSCVSPEKKKISLTKSQLEKMNKAFDFAKKKDFLKSAVIYSELSREVRGKEAVRMMLFNAGSAYKESGECKKALDFYRKVLDLSIEDPFFKAQALMEISYVYECLGEFESALLSLKDAEALRNHLPWVLVSLVHPARLSIVYAYFGKRDQANQSRSIVFEKIIESQKVFTSKKELNEEMSKAFYLMGRSYVKKQHLKPELFFQSFPYYQIYLLQSLFLKTEEWSGLSKKELEILFEKLIFAISKSKEKTKYREKIIEYLKDAKVFIQRENSKTLENFYNNLSQNVLKTLSSSD